MTSYESLLENFNDNDIGEVVLNVVRKQYTEVSSKRERTKEFLENEDDSDILLVPLGDLEEILSGVMMDECFTAQKLVRALKRVYHGFKTLKESRIHEVVKRCSSVALLGVCLACKYPNTGLKEDVGRLTWKDSCYLVIRRIQDAIKAEEPGTFKHNVLSELLYHWLNVLSVMHCFGLITSIRTVSTCTLQKNADYALHWASFFCSSLGDLQRYYGSLKVSQPNINMEEKHSKLAIELYKFAARLWPRNGKPLHNLAIIALSNDHLLDAFYYHVRSYLCISKKDRFSLSKQELGHMFSKVHKNYDECRHKLEHYPKLTIINLLDTNSTKFDILAFSTKDWCEILAIKDSKLIIPIRHNLTTQLLLPLNENPAYFDHLENTMITMFFLAFSYLNLKVIYKYSLDDFQDVFALWSTILNVIIDRSSTFFNTLAPYLLKLAIIVIFSMEIALHKRENDEVISDSDSMQHLISVLFAFRCALKLLLNLLNVMTKALIQRRSQTSHDNDGDDDDPIIIHLYQFLILTLAWINNNCTTIPNFRDVVFSLVPSGHLFFFCDLLNFLPITDPACSQDYISFPEQRIFDAFEHHVTPTSHLGVNSLARVVCLQSFSSNAYISHVRRLLLSIISKKVIPFISSGDGEHHLYVFDEAAYSEYQNQSDSATLPRFCIPVVKYEDFSLPFAGISSTRDLMMLYNLCQHYVKANNNPVIHHVRYVVPDTNCLLHCEDRINAFINNYFGYTIAIPILVLRELMGLVNPRSVNEGPELEKVELTSKYAGSTLKIVKQKLFSEEASKVVVLSNKGDVAKAVTENIAEYHDAFQRYDDVILTSVKHFNELNTYSIKSGSRVIMRQSVLFLTNDLVLRTKALNSEVLSITLESFNRMESILATSMKQK